MARSRLSEQKMVSAINQSSTGYSSAREQVLSTSRIIFPSTFELCAHETPIFDASTRSKTGPIPFPDCYRYHKRASHIRITEPAHKISVEIWRDKLDKIHTKGTPKKKEYAVVKNKAMADLTFDDVMANSQFWTSSRAKTPVVIGIIDSGFKMHPHIQKHLAANPEDEPGNQCDDDGNGKINDSHGWNFITHQSELSSIKPTHGTHVAGTALQGLHCTNPIFATYIRRNTGQFKAQSDPMLKEMLEYLAEKGAVVINLSFKFDTAEAKKIILDFLNKNQNIVIIHAAGNDGLDLHQVKHGSSKAAFIEHPRLWTVTSATRQGQKAKSANYGNPHVDFGALGDKVLAPVNINVAQRRSGTSVASAQVANAYAGVLETCPGLKPQQVKAIIALSADKAPDWVPPTDRVPNQNKEEQASLISIDANLQIPKPPTYSQKNGYTKHGVINRQAARILADLVYRTTIDGQSPEEAAKEAGLKSGVKEYYLELLSKYHKYPF